MKKLTKIRRKNQLMPSAFNYNVVVSHVTDSNNMTCLNVSELTEVTIPLVLLCHFTK